MAFTEEQLKAIESRGGDLLVSAAAGSGKTTVLVERIIRRILDEKVPVDIDRILVMTFTKAAAEQMKEKIIKAIDEKRALDPLNRHLIRQSALVHNAKISTIHGFCLDVIRNHFQEIGVDPDFRVADEAEAKLLKRDVLERVIEEAYERADDGFINMVECLAGGKNDKVLEDILDGLYDFSMSSPDPEEWLKRCEEIYKSPESDTAWLKLIMDNALYVTDDAYEVAIADRLICDEPDGPSLYEKISEQDIEIIKELKDAVAGTDLITGYERLHRLFNGLKWPVLPRGGKNAPYTDPDLKERYKKVREAYKKEISELAKNEFMLSMDEHIRRIRLCAPVVCELTSLTRKVAQNYSEAKRKRKIADFNDLEHMCIGILSAEDGNTAKEYREYFEEIYIDEYQDSNLVQEEILKYIGKGDNLFMVGDVKQSIYSFRLARPQLFMDKLQKASEEGSRLKRIDLSYNFRSRESVLKSVNELFAQVMNKDMGGIVYDEAASLHPGAYYPETDDLREKTELILVSTAQGIPDREMEAKTVASRIKRLMKEQRISEPSDEDPDRTRPVRYSDISILLRSAKGWDETFEKVLSAEGIPVHTMSQTGYFSATEISVILDYLRVLDNPLQDIPMAAVLKSVIGRFSDEDLAVLRIKHPEEYLYESVMSLAAQDCACGEDPDGKAETAIRRKALEFLRKYNELRAKSAYLPVYEILLELVDGEYGDCVNSMPDGKRRKANLNMLLKKAEDYGKTSYKGLFHFVRYIELLRKYEVDYGEAGILDEHDDTVRIMTIHKSKGLEFPVCIIAGMHKKYNFTDIKGSVIPDIDIGLGMDLSDPVRRIKLSTAVKRAVSKKKMYEILAEEERILYVAMTRAREKLIMTGMVNDIEKAMQSDKGPVRCASFLDLVLYGINNAGLPSVMVNTMTAEQIIDTAIEESVGYETRKEELKRLAGIRKGSADKPDAAVSGTGLLLERFAFRYPYENERRQFEKVSVTELKRRSMHAEMTEDKELPEDSIPVEESELPGTGKTLQAAKTDVKDITPFIPDFIREQEKEIPATLHGTAVHRVFEIWDYTRGTSDDDIRDFFEYIKREGLMEDDLVNCVKPEEVSGFVNSGLAMRMKKACLNGLLFREQPFMFGFEGIMIQGIIDSYFIEDDRIVIVDYKTDAVSDPRELAGRYHVQLEYYAKALSAMTGREISELIIYSTRHKCTVNIPYPVVN